MKRRHTRDELQELLGITRSPAEPLALDEWRQRQTAASPVQAADEHFAEWSAARAEANLAYDDWCHAPGLEGYFVYRAAEDRADAAEMALAQQLRLAA
jgi:hypothetical protein